MAVSSDLVSIRDRAASRSARGDTGNRFAFERGGTASFARVLGKSGHWGVAGVWRVRSVRWRSRGRGLVGVPRSVTVRAVPRIESHLEVPNVLLSSGGSRGRGVVDVPRIVTVRGGARIESFSEVPSVFLSSGGSPGDGELLRSSDRDCPGRSANRIVLGGSERVPLVRWSSRGRGVVDVPYRFTRRASPCCGTGSLRSRAAG